MHFIVYLGRRRGLTTDGKKIFGVSLEEALQLRDVVGGHFDRTEARGSEDWFSPLEHLHAPRR